MPIHKDIGYVLKSYDFRRTSKIATFYTLEYGKLTGIFKAFKVKKDKFITSLDTFTLNEFIFYDKKGPIWLVTEATLIDSFEPLKKHLPAYYGASYVMEFIDAVASPQLKNEQVFSLIQKTFQYLPQTPAPLLITIFQLKMLLYLGWYPSLLHCVQCNREVDERSVFSIKRGGLICEHCMVSHEAYIRVLSETVLVLRYILKYNFPQVTRLKVSDAALAEIRRILDAFIEYHLHTVLRSKRFISHELCRDTIAA